MHVTSCPSQIEREIKMLDRAHVERVAASLVREYLSRKGLKSSLQSMDQEMPRTEDSISNRLQLAKEVHIEKLLKKNKEEPEPLRSMIEIITKYFLEKALQSSAKIESVPLHGLPEPSLAAEAQHGTPSLDNMIDKTLHDESKSSSSGHKNRGSKTNSSTKPLKSSLIEANELEFGAGLPQEDVGGTYRLDRGATPIVTIRERPNVIEPENYLTQTEEKLSRRIGGSCGINTQDLEQSEEGLVSRNVSYSTGVSGAINSKKNALPKKTGIRPGSASRNRGLGSPVTSSLDNYIQKQPAKKSTSTRASLDKSSLGSSLDAGVESDRLSAANRNRLKDLGFTFDLHSKDIVGEETAAKVAIESPQYRPESLSCRSLTDFETKTMSDSKDENESSLRRPSTMRAEGNKRRTSPSKQTFGDIELGDIDDLKDDLGSLQLKLTAGKAIKAADARPITQKEAMEMKTLLFGSSTGCFNEEWRMQGLGFNDVSKLEFGIIQHKGGPCGILASIQSYMLKHLLFGDKVSMVTRALQPTNQERSECLAQAICDITWRAGEKFHSVVAIPSHRAQFTSTGRCKADGLTEKLVLNHFKKREELLEFITSHISVFESNASSGCILVLYSAIQSRTVDKIIEDMDEPTSRLMGAHGYCTQEMVNLLLTGRAVSNVFNDMMELDSGIKERILLKGVNSRSEIGLLSLFEHFGSCKVGSNYKTPRYPIWIVCSESHFSVLFCLKKELLSDWKAERRFDLFYFDGLARQQDQIRLSIDTTQSCQEVQEGDLVPPLEHCIRTKWPDAVVNWNGTEPIL